MTSLEDWPRLTWSLGWTSFGSALAAQQLGGPVGDDLVGVHVGGGAGAGLEDVDHELVVEAALGHLRRRPGDGLGDARLQEAQLGVHLGGAA